MNIDILLIISWITVLSCLFFTVVALINLAKTWSAKGFIKISDIPKGEHRDKIRLYPTLLKKDFKVEFKIGLNAWANPNTYQGDQINKIYGLSHCILPRVRIIDREIRIFTPHHWNSTRIGFNSSQVEGVYHLYLYKYRKGVRISEFMYEFNGNEVQRFESNHFGLKKSFLGYHLWPYIGGVLPAHRNTIINVNVLNENHGS